MGIRTNLRSGVILFSGIVRKSKTKREEGPLDRRLNPYTKGTVKLMLTVGYGAGKLNIFVFRMGSSFFPIQIKRQKTKDKRQKTKNF